MLKLLGALCGVSILTTVFLLTQMPVTTDAASVNLIKVIGELNSQIGELETTVSSLQDKVNNIDQNYAEANKDGASPKQGRHDSAAQ
jgi:hypothetical protein